ncbi:glycosyltransferase family 2 protein [Seonamhaeicola aphaedonensis]|uniref:Glycosyltransferase involved in cell wall biosynthesis n=1 Tax=Seonamhaeicola aphaedonensis TaxID=1461338 RepID=A0A3D9HFW5_9FLAO|nr:glycosyltransferase family 2 protein [Seonamhaeicola aphaedonensis]RED48373.1 glycosyltransferase involved in cell wall biosynthesis [Seonamhaeicola aphaedonensis]
MQPLISIIIPNYNRASLITESLDSVLSQTYKHWECLVVDDGSTDNSEAVVKKYTETDKRIRFYKRPEFRTKGANTCRNYGLELSQGDYVNWLDSDDIMHPDKLLKQLEALELSSLNYSICKSYVFENTIENLNGLKSKNIAAKNPFQAFISKFIVIPVQASLFRKSFLLENNYRYDEDLQAGQEWFFLAKIFFNYPEYAVVDEPLDYIRSHPNNISNHTSNKKYWHYFLARFKLYNELKDQLTIENTHTLHIFFLFVFKLFVRFKDFKEAWYVWCKCLVPYHKLSLRDHINLVFGSLLKYFFNKGDGYLGKVSLYE